jgi:isoquinoline 1-oxidoreductase beta subunit
MPAKERVRIMAPSERRWEGKRMPSVDLVPMTTGTAMYGADMTLPGMKVAVISRPPVWGGKVVSVDDSLALKVPGVERVVRIPETPVPSAFFPLGGVAVIAKNTWAAIRGRDALRITWDGGSNATYDSTAYKATLLSSVRAPGKAGRAVGDVPKAMAGAAKRVTAEYYMPHLSHAQMEPVAALANVANGKVEVWAPTQSPQDARNTVAQYLKVDAANVADEIFDMVGPRQPGVVTFEDLRRSKMGGIVCGILMDASAFVAYDRREEFGGQGAGGEEASEAE